MSAHVLKSMLLKGSLVTAVLGAGIIAYVGWTASRGIGDDDFSLAFHPFAAFYGAYLVYFGRVLRRDFTPRRVHQYLSALFVPVAFIALVAILGGEKSTTWIRVAIAFAAFVVVGALYKFTLARFGAILFGHEIRE